MEYCLGSEKDNELDEHTVSHHCRLYYLKHIKDVKHWVEITDEQLDLFTVGDLHTDPIIFLVDVDLNYDKHKYKYDSKNGDGQIIQASWARQKTNWREFNLYDIIDVEDINNKWYEAQITEVADSDQGGTPTKVKIHYINWSDNWDEWIDVGCDRIAKRSTHSSGPYSC